MQHGASPPGAQSLAGIEEIRAFEHSLRGALHRQRTMRFAYRMVLASGAALFATTAFAASTSPWVAATPIADRSGRPDVAMDPEGNAIATWWTEAAGIEVATRRAGARSWRLEQITRGDEILPWANPQARVGVDAKGNATVVWVEQEDSAAPFRIMAARRPARGPFGVPKVVAADIQQFPVITLEVGSGGHAIVLWTRRELPEDVTYAEAALALPGKFFGPPQRLGSGLFLAAQAQDAAVDGQGRMLAVWEALDGTIYAASAAPGERFAPTRLISGSSEGYRSWPEVAFGPNGSAVAVWSRSTTSSEMSVLESASRTVRGTWRAPELVSAVALQTNPHRVALDAGGTAHAIWIAGSGEERRIVTSFRSADSGWRKPSLLVPSSADSLTGLDLAANASGAAIAVWQGRTTLAAAYLRNGRWSSPAPLWPGAPGVQAGLAYARPAIDATGNALVVWPSFRSSMRAAGYDAVGPQLRMLRIPATGRVGKQLGFSASPLDVWTGRTVARWSFGDGGRATGSSVAHSYRRSGTYTVTVISSDSLGHTTTASRRIRIRSVA